MQDAIILYENGKAIGGEGHPTDADDITFNNAGTDIAANKVGSAIKEVNAKTSGLTRTTIGWTNPSPTANFAPQTIVLSDTDYDALEVDTAYNSSGSLSSYQTFKLTKGVENQLQILSASGTNIQYFYRFITDGGNGNVQVSRGARILQGTSGSTELNNALVPLVIRLIKYI